MRCVPHKSKTLRNPESVTLNSAGVRKAITAFVDLVEKNPEIDIDLHFLTTSKIGKEQAHSDRPAGFAGLKYWKKVAAGADVGPLSTILESGKFGEVVSQLLQKREKIRIFEILLSEKYTGTAVDRILLRFAKNFISRLVVIGQDLFHLPPEEARRLVNHLVYRVLETSIIDDSERRVLTRADFYELVSTETRISVPRTFLASLPVQFASAFNHSFGEQGSVGETGSVGHTDLFINGHTLPVLRQMIPRPDVENSAGIVLKEHGICVLVGGSGVGKSVVARRIADQRSNVILHCGLP